MDLTVQQVTPEIPSSSLVYVFYENVTMKDVNGNDVIIPQEKYRFTREQILYELSLATTQKQVLDDRIQEFSALLTLINPPTNETGQ